MSFVPGKSDTNAKRTEQQGKTDESSSKLIAESRNSNAEIKEEVDGEFSKNEPPCSHSYHLVGTGEKSTKSLSETATLKSAPKENNQSSNTDGKFPCAYCSNVYNNKGSRSNHYSKNHRAENNLARHGTLHTKRSSSGEVSSSPVKCQFCTKIFEAPSRMRMHVSHSHRGLKEPSPEDFDCSYCQKHYDKFGSLYFHHINHHSDKPKPIKEYFRTSGVVNVAKNQNAVKDREKVDETKQTTTDVSRKRVRDDSPKATKNMDNSKVITAPPFKKHLTAQKEQQPSTMPPRSKVIEAFENIMVGIPSAEVDVKIEENYIIAPSTSPNFGSPNSGNVFNVGEEVHNEVKIEPTEAPEIIISSSPFHNLMRNDLANSPMSNTPLNLSDQVRDKLIEKSPLPLTVAVWTRAKEYPSQLMIIWTNFLDEDLQSAVSLNSDQCVLCIQELDMFKLVDEQREKLKNSHMVTFPMSTADDNSSLWTVITFGEQNQSNGLRNKLFHSFEEVEKVFSNYAEAKGKTMVNLTRFSKNGLFPLLSQQLAKKIMGFNCDEEQK